MEMGDQSTIRCDSLDLICELEFKTKVRVSIAENLKKGLGLTRNRDTSRENTTLYPEKLRDNPQETFFMKFLAFGHKSYLLREKYVFNENILHSLS